MHNALQEDYEAHDQSNSLVNLRLVCVARSYGLEGSKGFQRVFSFTEYEPAGQNMILMLYGWP